MERTVTQKDGPANRRKADEVSSALPLHRGAGHRGRAQTGGGDGPLQGMRGNLRTRKAMRLAMQNMGPTPRNELRKNSSAQPMYKPVRWKEVWTGKIASFC